MAGGIDWFRWHHGSATDPKFRLIAKKAGARTSEVVAVWACLLESASAAEDRGNAGTPDFESIDLALDMEEGTASRIYERMCERDVIDADTGRVVAWEKRQPKREREDDGAAERKRNQRARDAASAEHVTPHETDAAHVTPCHATSRQKKPREEKRREEKREETKTRAVALPSDVSEAVFADWQALRRAKKAPITATALDGIRREAEKAGIPMEAALAMSCERGWTGFKAEWIRDRGGGLVSKQTALEARNRAVIDEYLTENP